MGAALGVQPGDGILKCAILVLNEPDPHQKAKLTQEIVSLWNQGLIALPVAGETHPTPPDRPARDDTKVRLVAPADVPRRGKGGSLASRQALLHSLVHIESWAVDLAWDAIARFGGNPSLRLPRQFFDDFVRVAEDECRHFCLLEQRLQETGSHYGAFPGHDALWESASSTAGSLPARLAVEHCCHEARGLDVLPQTIHRFRSNGDAASAALLQDVIYAEEISHCAAGVRWLRYLHALACGGEGASQAEQEQQQQQPGLEQTGQQQQELEQRAQQQQQVQQKGQQQEEEGEGAGLPSSSGIDILPGSSSSSDWAADARAHATVEQWFHALIRRHFRGPLKPPFNEEARAQAGFGPEWYLPLAAPPGKPAAEAS